MFIISALSLLFRSLFASRLSLATEILIRRQQLLVLNCTVKRPKLRQRDRLFWVCLSKLWKDWRDALIIVKPDTVIKWHREGFRLYWQWKSKAPIGRPPIDKEIRELIRRISRENPLYVKCAHMLNQGARCLVGLRQEELALYITFQRS